MNTHSLATLWASIESSGLLPAAALRFLDTGVTFNGGTVFAGVDGASQRHLCIPAPTSELGRIDRSSKGVTIEVRPLLNRDGEETPFVDIHCRRPDLNSLFEIVASDILSECQKHPASPFGVAHVVLERWRELLETGDSAPLGPQQLAALLAELLLLEKLGGTGVPPVRYWMGPDKGPHDFVCGSADFEVKSTLTTSRREIEVHGLTQLTPAPGTTLYMWWVRLRAAPGRGATVPGTIERLRKRSVDLGMLMKKLKLAGYAASEAERYQETSFEIVESLLYAVDEDFPRLTEDSFGSGLPPQVSNVVYTINLDASKPIPLNSTESEAIFASIG